MSNTEHIWLKQHGACAEALEWLGTKTLAQGWTECTEARWLLWYAGEVGTDKSLFVRVAVAIARRVLKYIPVGEGPPRLAVEATERWLIDPSEENRRAAGVAADAAHAAARTARAAAHAAAYAATRAAAYTATYAADAATYAARAAAAAYPAHAAAQATTYAAARATTYAAEEHPCVAIVREIIPFKNIT